MNARLRSSENRRPPAARRRAEQLGAVVLVVAIGLAISYFRDRDTPAPAAPAGIATREQPTRDVDPSAESTVAPPVERANGAPAREQPRAKKDPSAPETPNDRGPIIEGVTIRDERGRVVYRGDVDLEPTLDRIAAGERLRFRHDGIVFENREGRLPKQSRGYYREYVHPTPNLDGPGPQRLVIGQAGEVFYTHDHYRSFRRIRR